MLIQLCKNVLYLAMKISGVVMGVVVYLRFLRFVAKRDEKLISTMGSISLPGYLQLIVSIMSLVILRGRSTVLFTSLLA
jgi:hypothetical protein